MIKIILNLSLINKMGAEIIEVEVENSTTLKDLLKQACIDQELVGMVTRDNLWISAEEELFKGDVLKIFPHLDGG